jgi:bile acid:Na+ symporter, BASS family
MTAAQWVGLGLQVSIMLMVLALGLTARWRDATYMFRKPVLLLRAVLSMSVIMPIVAAVIAWLFAERLEVQASLVALAVSPVPPIIHSKQLKVGASREFVIGLLAAMALLAIVFVPLTVVVLDVVFGRSATLTPGAVAVIMLKTILVPLALGIAIYRLFPAAEKAVGVIVIIGGLLLAGGSLILLYAMWPIICAMIGNGLVLGLVVLAVLGLLVGHILGGPVPGNRTALALTTASRHPAVALAIATSGAVTDLKPPLAVILLYLVVATVVSIPYTMWRKREEVAAASS